MTDVFAGDSPLLANLLGRLQSVKASLASLANSSDGERAAEDVPSRRPSRHSRSNPSSFGWPLCQDDRNRLASFVTSNQAVDVISLQERFEALEDSLAALLSVRM